MEFEDYRDKLVWLSEEMFRQITRFKNIVMKLLVWWDRKPDEEFWDSLHIPSPIFTEEFFQNKR